MNSGTKYGLVVLLDALGTRTSSLSDSMHYLGAVKTLKKRIQVSLNTTLQAHYKDPDIVASLDTLRPRFFGDSVLITYEITDQQLFVHYLSRILFILNLFLVEAIGQRILFRGAIGIGEYVQRSDVVLGPVVVDVAHWYEQMNMIGAMLTPTSANIVRSIVGPAAGRKYNEERPMGDFIHWQKIPTKTGSVEGYLLDWPHFVRYINKKDTKKALQWFYDHMSKFCVAPGTEEKYSNTDTFFRASLRRSETSEKKRP